MQNNKARVEKPNQEPLEGESQSPLKFFLFVFGIPFLIILAVVGLLNALY